MKKTARVPAVCSVAALLALLAAAAGFAQKEEEPKGEFGELIEVTEVFLDVVATDRKGNVVAGLGKDDFIVREGGEPVEITSLAFYTTRHEGETAAAAGASAGEAAPELPASRYFIFLFHDQRRNALPGNRLLQQQLDAGRRAHEWVRDQVTGSDWVAVLSYDVKLVVHQDFSQDTGSLVKAINDAAVGNLKEAPVPSERGRMTAGSEPSLWRGLPDVADLDRETTRLYDALRLVAEACRPIVGRKNVLLFTAGFGELDPGLGIARPDVRFYPDMEQALNDNNVAVYPIDLVPPELNHTQSDFLTQLAVDTGGYYHRNVVNFITPLQLISKENRGYYLLSFRTEYPAGEKGYREIDVKAKSGKIRVRTRRGYRYGV
ncbi:MAG TPA: VWA domain-containing protein [Thermoanaerobaculia bacterium]